MKTRRRRGARGPAARAIERAETIVISSLGTLGPSEVTMPRPCALLIAALAAACSAASDDRGRDTGGDPPDDTDATGDAGGDAGEDECEGIDFPVAGHPPRALVVLDRSGSMGGEPPSPWDACETALVEITAQLDYQIQFGLLLFPVLDEVCAAPGPDPEVPIGPSSSAAIAAAMAEAGPYGNGTPTAASLQSAFEYVAALAGEDDRFVILATDGAPNCSDNPTYDCASCEWTAIDCTHPWVCLDDQGTLAVVTEYNDNWGIPTYVIGIGGVVAEWDALLSDLALQGGTGDYFPAQTDDGPDEMIAALQEIAAANTLCVFDVDWDALADGVSHDPTLVNLYAEGAIVPYSEGCAFAGGWRWADADTIELCPGLCDDYKWGVVSWIHASFGCETVVE